MSLSRPALLIIDMFNRFDFDGGEQLAHRAQGAAHSIHALAARFRQAQRPVIYINDNVSDWHADLPSIIAVAAQPDARGCDIARLLAPQPQDYRMLKPTHSAFGHTPLAPLLKDLQVDQVVITGVALDVCVLATAVDAVARGLSIAVPRDCTTAETDTRESCARTVLQEGFHASLARSGSITLG
ncbi:isochorismatase family cysteine hydrolase [Xanthomonas sp. NCPPB 1068]|uniref:isochorismatase family cysteine hydrolase n=1 Tax=Xanthomonas sp. NCPPB 1068 TaxID=487525 RepID=UPI00355654C3